MILDEVAFILKFERQYVKQKEGKWRGSAGKENKKG